MISATIQPIHVSPELLQHTQSVLKEEERLSSFAEDALRKQIENRKPQQEFIARGLAARDKAKATGAILQKKKWPVPCDKFFLTRYESKA